MKMWTNMSLTLEMNAEEGQRLYRFLKDMKATGNESPVANRIIGLYESQDDPANA